jgi:hypothetical protein
VTDQEPHVHSRVPEPVPAVHSSGGAGPASDAAVSAVGPGPFGVDGVTTVAANGAHQAVTAPHQVRLVDTGPAVAAAAVSSASAAAASPAVPSWQVRLWRALSRQARFGAAVGLVLGVVLGALTGVAAANGTTRWTSTTTMMIDDPYQLATAGDQGELLKLNSLLVKYAGLLGTDVIARPIAQQLGLSVNEVLHSVTANNNPATETLLLPITATASTPELAQRLASTAAHELTAYVEIQNVEFHIPPADQFTLTTVDPASTPVRHGPSKTKAASDALAVGVVVFVLGMAATQLVRNRRLLFG